MYRLAFILVEQTTINLKTVQNMTCQMFQKGNIVHRPQNTVRQKEMMNRAQKHKIDIVVHIFLVHSLETAVVDTLKSGANMSCVGNVSAQLNDFP